MPSFLSVFENLQYVLLVLLPGIALSGAASWLVRTRFAKYSKVPSTRGYTGQMAAERLLEYAGINDVNVVRVDGILTDHYNPMTRKLALSSEVFDRTSVAAIGVATHEAGHAIQHATGYLPLKWRSAIVPIANIGTRFGQWAMIIGLVVWAGAYGVGKSIFIGGALAFFVFILFQLITLPVEFNASSRAKKLIVEAGIVGEAEREGIDKVLSAAALTYIAALVSSIITMVYFLSRSGLFSEKGRSH